MRRTYTQFARLVARARREVLREMGDPRIPVAAYGVETPFFAQPVWGEFYPDERSIALYQLAYEAMPDQERYYPQIKDVLRHEYGHADGDDHGEEGPTFEHFAQAPNSWVGSEPYTVVKDGWAVTLP